jgi:hypothetical protein
MVVYVYVEVCGECRLGFDYEELCIYVSDGLVVILRARVSVYVCIYSVCVYMYCVSESSA